MPAYFSNKVKDYKSKIKKTCQEIKDIYYFIQKIKQQILSFEIDKNSLFSKIKNDIEPLNYKNNINNNNKILKYKNRIKKKKIEIINKSFNNKADDKTEKKDMNQILEKKNIFVSTNILAFNSKDNKNNLEEKNRIISKKKIVENNLINKEHKI